MKRYAIAVLCALNVALAGGLALAWLNPDGSLRNVHWSVPEPIFVDYLAAVPLLPGRTAVDIGRVMAMTDRPLFSPTRRPPPPPPPTVAPEEVAVDSLSSAKILGVYEGTDASGVVISIAGKNRRVRLNEGVDGWTLKSVQGKTVVFERSGQRRSLQLTRALIDRGTVNAAPLPAALLPAAPLSIAPGMPESGQQTPPLNSNSAAPSQPAGARRFGP